MGLSVHLVIKINQGVCGKYLCVVFSRNLSVVCVKYLSVVFGRYLSVIFSRYLSVVFGRYQSVVFGRYLSVVLGRNLCVVCVKYQSVVFGRYQFVGTWLRYLVGTCVWYVLCYVMLIMHLLITALVWIYRFQNIS